MCWSFSSYAAPGFATPDWQRHRTSARILLVSIMYASSAEKVSIFDWCPSGLGAFFHTLKTELVHHRNYQTRAYNRTRLQPSKLSFAASTV